METKYRCTKHGLMSMEKWNTVNTQGVEIFVEDQLACGLKLTFDSSSHQTWGIGAGCWEWGDKVWDAQVPGQEGWLAGWLAPRCILRPQNLGGPRATLRLATRLMNCSFTLIEQLQPDEFRIYSDPKARGVRLTLSALLDGKIVNTGGHKLGLGLECKHN
ncbi:hypothetical protein GH733_005653 [Mirounga leonina]|nr:hypothetical protein GH733_005653 [Mirounga leonina]